MTLLVSEMQSVKLEWDGRLLLTYLGCWVLSLQAGLYAKNKCRLSEKGFQSCFFTLISKFRKKFEPNAFGSGSCHGCNTDDLNVGDYIIRQNDYLYKEFNLNKKGEKSKCAVQYMTLSLSTPARQSCCSADGVKSQHSHIRSLQGVYNVH